MEERNSQFSTNYLFNAKELDNETGLYYYGARYLDPTGAMWLSVDPMWEKYMGISPYAYCMGNPVRLKDPDGNDIVDFVPVVGSGRDVYQGFRDGNGLLVASGIVFLGVDIFTMGSGSLAKGVIKNGVKYLLRSSAKNATKSAAGATVKNTNKSAAKNVLKGANNPTVRKSKEIGQEAHRQIESELVETKNAMTEVKINLGGGKTVRKDAVLPDGTVVIIKPQTPSGVKSALKREQLMKDHGFKTEIRYYDPKYLPGSPTYIGPKN